MTIAITGATGHLGGLVVDALLDRADLPAGQIVALARDLDKAAPLAAKGVTVRAFDYDQPDALARELDDVTALLLISGNAVGQRFAQHRAVIDAAKAAGVRRLVYTSVESSAASLAESVNPVAPEHAQTEDYLAASGVPHVVLRNSWYHENYLGELQTTGTLVTSAGDGRVASAARRDYAEAAAAVLTAADPRPLYRLTGDVAWGLDDLAGDLTSVLGRPVDVNRVSPEQHREILRGAGLDSGLIDFIVGVDAAISAGELATTTGDLAALIGRPTTALIDVLRAGADGGSQH